MRKVVSVSLCVFLLAVAAMGLGAFLKRNSDTGSTNAPAPTPGSVNQANVNSSTNTNQAVNTNPATNAHSAVNTNAGNSNTKVNVNQTTTNTNTSTNTNQSAPNGITRTELARHNNSSDCWLLISDKVYDVSSYLRLHPGGSSIIVPYCGKDATTAFATQDGEGRHSSVAQRDLAEYLLGSIARE